MFSCDLKEFVSYNPTGHSLYTSQLTSSGQNC